MILQVHDELLFEAPKRESGEADEAGEGRDGERDKLAVPLVVEIGVGSNWRDLEDVEDAD